MNSTRKGFTLIELLMVIAIIALLSSIVLASLNSARLKARQKVYRAEVMQVIGAIEMFKTDNGYYPGEDTGVDNVFNAQTVGGALSTSSTPTTFDLYGIYLKKYMKKMPMAPTESSYFQYVRNYPDRTCFGRTDKPKYIIKVSTSQPGFEDWPYYSYLGVADTNFRCFAFE